MGTGAAGLLADAATEPAVREALQVRLRAYHPEVRFSLLRADSHWYTEAHTALVDVLAPSLDDPQVRKRLLRALADRYSSSAVQLAVIGAVRPIAQQWSIRRALKAAAKDRDPEVAAAAAKALGRWLRLA